MRIDKCHQIGLLFPYLIVLSLIWHETNMRKTNPETHQACRSLLQKAVRRGDVSLTQQVAYHLHTIGDTSWLRTRALVIVFEECWPLAAWQHLTTNIQSVFDMLVSIGRAVKMKDAAGLGTLAYELSRGDTSVLTGETEDQHIQHLCGALKDPNNFWDWAVKKSSSKEQFALVEAAHKAYRRGGWPWDRAFMQASAYLAVHTDKLVVSEAGQNQEKFPLWIALDKHTSQGKIALREAAAGIGVPVRQLSWISFYCESARLNEATDSYWWSREVCWRFSRIGLNYEKAQALWSKAQPIVSGLLKEETEALQQHLSTASSSENCNKTDQQLCIQELLWEREVSDAPLKELFRTSNIFRDKPEPSRLPGF